MSKRIIKEENTITTKPNATTSPPPEVPFIPDTFQSQITNFAQTQIMESYSGGLKGYWKSRRPYTRLETTHCRKSPVIHLIDPNRQKPRRRFWRFRVKPRLRIVGKALRHPGWFLAKIRDGYVRMMLKWAGSYGGGGVGGEFGLSGFPNPAVKEYDEKVIVEIYKSLVLQRQALAAAKAAAAAGGSGGEERKDDGGQILQAVK